ncbi:hypothetical protein Glove_505g32 [Diversispora epigaea]|uniref:Uncharacterized protein n=1 Tax=Diversispora epigaea TaxID=1348612 RepID=A0A397GGG1_9GLOM|nr:hypothetical protein Glove_505g32 [Diversispora epigaea]
MDKPQPQPQLQQPQLQQLQPQQLQQQLQRRGSESAKRKLYTSLNNQFARLQQNMLIMEQNIEITSEQIKSIQNFGMAHSALFMAANRVLRTDNRDDKN